MSANFKQEGLTISRSDVPVIRVGFANIIFLLLFFGLILINQALNDFGIDIFIKEIILLCFCLATLKVYTHSISKIIIKDQKKLVIVGPFSNTEIDSAEIYRTTVYGIPSSMTIFLKVKKKLSFLPSVYFFVAVSTNYGSYADTKKKLILLMKQFDIK